MTSLITDEMVEAGVEEIRKAKHTCFDRWTDHDAIRAVLEAGAEAALAAKDAEIAKLREALDECEDYFDNRADADCDETGFIPNEEMKLLHVVRTALERLPAPSSTTEAA